MSGGDHEPCDPVTNYVATGIGFLLAALLATGIGPELVAAAWEALVR